VGHHTEAFVGIDTSKLRNAVAIADGGRGGEVRYLGEFPATEAAIQKLVAKLAAKYRHLTFCYEAGPTGYGLYRLLKSLSHECLVVAPSLIPKKAGDRVKTNRRDAVKRSSPVRSTTRALTTRPPSSIRCRVRLRRSTCHVRMSCRALAAC
jgi:transposase